MAKEAKKSTGYGATAIRKMDGIEHIRARPSMYIPDTGSDGMHHLGYEIVDNAVDEHIANNCSSIHVILDTKAQRLTVVDNGRGIPVEKHAQTGKPTIEGIFTETMMGGKFDKQAYTISGGLHGVGAKATCALSDEMQVETFRDGSLHRVTFAKGEVTQGTKKIRTAKKGEAGTTVSFHPDPEIFGKMKFDPARFRDRLESVAFLNPELTVQYTVDGKLTDLTASEGLAGLLKSRKGKKEKEIFETPITFRVFGAFADGAFVEHKKRQADSESIAVAMWWTDADAEEWWSWVNMIPVKNGGTHVTGAKKAITKALGEHCKSAIVTGDDFREGLRVAVSLLLKHPHFEGQSKNRLNNPEAQAMAERIFTAHFEQWIVKNADVVKVLVTRAVAMAEARRNYKAAKGIASQAAYAKKDSRGSLPTALATAPRCEVAERELFVVEGDSAGGSAKQGRMANSDGDLYQEVLGLKGKPPNPMRAATMPQLAALFDNNEFSNIIRSIGAGHDVETPGQTCAPDKARVGKIIIMADADPDGGHISVLLIGFFLRFMLPLAEAGMLWVALPPLFVGSWPGNRVFGDSVEEVTRKAEKKTRAKIQITRLKGLGEMQAEQLRETAMNPATRRLVRLTADKTSIEHLTALLGLNGDQRKGLLGLL